MPPTRPEKATGFYCPPPSVSRMGTSRTGKTGGNPLGVFRTLGTRRKEEVLFGSLYQASGKANEC